MSGQPELEGHQFVVHMFVTTDRPGASDNYNDLRRFWGQCRNKYEIGPRADQETGADGVLDSCQGAGLAPSHMILRRENDVFCLGVLRESDGAAAGWSGLDAEWKELLSAPPAGMIGTVQILQARLKAGSGEPDLAHGPVVAAASGIAADRWRGTVVRRP